MLLVQGCSLACFIGFCSICRSRCSLCRGFVCTRSMRLAFAMNVFICSGSCRLQCLAKKLSALYVKFIVYWLLVFFYISIVGSKKGRNVVEKGCVLVITQCTVETSPQLPFFFKLKLQVADICRAPLLKTIVLTWADRTTALSNLFSFRIF